MQGVIQSSSIDGTSKIWSMSKYQCLKLIDNDHRPIQSHQQIEDDHMILHNKGHYAYLRNVEDNLVIQTQEGHTGTVKSLLHFKDLIVTGSDDSTIRVQDKLTSTSLRTFKGHLDSVICLKIFSTPQAIFLVSGSVDCSIKIWNINSGECERTLAHRSPVQSLSITTDPTGVHMILSGHEDGTAILWSPFSDNPISQYVGHSDQVSTLDVYENLDIKDDNSYNKCIVTGSKDGTVKIWNVKGDCLKTVQMQHGVNALTICDLGRTLVSGLDNGEIVVQDLVEDVEVQRYLGHENEVTHVGINMYQDRLKDYKKKVRDIVDDRKKIKWGNKNGKYSLDNKFEKEVSKEKITAYSRTMKDKILNFIIGN